jgi:SP family sugar porter-like MFS transporter
MTIVLGILAAQIVNWLLARPVPDGSTNADILASWNGQMGWRWMFWAETVPAASFLLLAFFIPESPRWKSMKATAFSASLKTKKQSSPFSRKYAGVLVLGIVIAVFQQWCGTNVIFNYAQEIFSAAGYAVGDVLFNIVITGIANVVFTVVALFTVDRLGRRSLMLLGAGGLCLIYLILGTCYHFHVTGFFMVVLVVAAIACYAMTLGPITWVLLSEIFPDRVRGAAMAVCAFALWTGCCTLTFSFPSLNAALGSSGTFWIYSTICLCGFLFFLRKLPETKGKSLEELEQQLTK